MPRIVLDSRFTVGFYIASCSIKFAIRNGLIFVISLKVSYITMRASKPSSQTASSTTASLFAELVTYTLHDL